MWLSNLLMRMRFKDITRNASTIHPQRPSRQVCEDLLEELSPELFESYRPDVGLSVMITPHYRCIDLYTAKLKELNVILKRQVPVPPDWVTSTGSEVSVDRFFVTSDGYYVDPPTAIAQFKEAGLQLCALMKESDEAEHGIHEHNLRMLTKLFIDLRQITTKLIEVSLTK